MAGEKNWSIGRATLYGAIAGLVVMFARPLLFGETLPAETARVIGEAIGSVIGGGFLFAVVAAIRNRFA